MIPSSYLHSTMQRRQPACSRQPYLPERPSLAALLAAPAMIAAIGGLAVVVDRVIGW